MATKTLNVRFQQKYDTAENWAKSTIKLLAGEIAVESDTGKFKFGNGEDVFADLSYAGIDQAQLDAIEDNYHHVVPQIPEGSETMETDAQALARAVETPKKGDIAVCERTISGDRKSMTAYMYNGSAWSALDGNYDATNVYFEKDITLAGKYTQVGNVKKGENETKTLSAAGKNLAEVMQSIFTQEIKPGDTGYGIDLPSASITVSGSSEAVEVGNTFTLPTATLKITDVGSYPFEPKATGITFAAGDVSLSQGGNTVKNEGALAANGTITLQATGTDTTFGDDNIAFTFTGTASYGASPVTPKSNLGNEVANKKIAAGSCTVSSQTANFKGYRKWFYGGDNKTDFASDTIRALTNSSAKVSGTTFELKAASYSGCSRIVIAIPANGGKVLKGVLLKSSSNADITSEFKKINTDAAPIQVAGYNGYTPINYNVWEYKPASLDSTEVYTITIG